MRTITDPDVVPADDASKAAADSHHTHDKPFTLADAIERARKLASEYETGSVVLRDADTGPRQRRILVVNGAAKKSRKHRKRRPRRER